MVELIRIPYEEIIAKINEKTGMDQIAIEQRIKEKLGQLSGLVSREGAAYIIANELGVKLMQNTGKIKDVYAGMRNVTVTGRVITAFEPREFTRQDGSIGKVTNIQVGDDTGTIRIVCWGKHADTAATAQQGTIIKTTGGLAKENERGYKEVHLNDQSTIELNLQGITIPEMKATEKKIAELTPNDNLVEIKGTVVEVYDPRYFEVCPECTSRLNELEGLWACEKHGTIDKPQYSYVMNVLMDDGTGTTRVVLFRNTAEQMLAKTKEQMLAYREDATQFQAEKDRLLGEQFKILGRAKQNTFFNRTEFIAQKVDQIK